MELGYPCEEAVTASGYGTENSGPHRCEDISGNLFIPFDSRSTSCVCEGAFVFGSRPPLGLSVLRTAPCAVVKVRFRVVG